MNRLDNAALAAWYFETRAIKAMLLLIAAAAGFGYWRHGAPGLIAGLIVLWLFSLARPGPSEQLDRVTNRKGR